MQYARHHEQQHQQRVGIVVPEHQRRHRRQRQRGAGDQPGRGPAARRTVQYSSATAATPISACGSSMVNALKLNSLPDRPIAHIAAGGLSTVMALPASKRPEQPGLPVLRAGLRGGGVVAVGPAR